MVYVLMIVGCLLSSNIILSRFLGICPFLGISKNPKNAIGMGLALIFVVFCSAILSYCVYNYVLVPLELTYLNILVLILIIASFVQFVEFFMKKYMKSLYKALGIYLPLITTNCVVLQVSMDVLGNNPYSGNPFTFPEMLVYSIAVAGGYTLVITLFSFIRTRIDSSDATPKPFKGNAIALITASLMVLAFLAFAGLA